MDTERTERLVDEARALVLALRLELRDAIEFDWMKAPRLCGVLRNANTRLYRRQRLHRNAVLASDSINSVEVVW